MTTFLSPKGTFPAKIIEIVSADLLVMDRGKQHNIQIGRRVLIYEPMKKEFKGIWEYTEILKGIGRVSSVKEDKATIEFNQTGYNPKIGDFVKPI